jgi:hypothetical protein
VAQVQAAIGSVLEGRLPLPVTYSSRNDDLK